MPVMAVLSDKYQFWLLGGLDENTPVQQLYPVNSKIEFKWEQPENCIFYRQHLDTPLIFVNNKSAGLLDFDVLYGVEQNGACGSLKLLIKRNCDGSWIDYWRGAANMRKGKWDVSNCRVEITFDVIDRYSCVLSYMNLERDIFASGWVDRVTARTNIGTWSVARIEQPIISLPIEYDEFNQVPDGPGWLAYMQLIMDHDIDGDLLRNNQTYFVREIYTGTQPGPDWVSGEIAGTWVRKPAFYKTAHTIGYSCDDPNVNANRSPIVWDKAQRRFLAKPIFEMDNGVKLVDVIERLLACNDGGALRSNVLSHNTGGAEPPNNAAYTYAYAHLNNLTLWQTSDVARADASHNASVFKIKLGQLLDDLRKAYNIYWDIDDDGYFRLEHLSYWQFFSRVVDITGLPGIVDKYQYTYVNNMPQSEQIKWAQDVKPVFNHSKIKYTGNCVALTDDVEQCELLTPDIYTLYLNEHAQKFYYRIEYNAGVDPIIPELFEVDNAAMFKPNEDEEKSTDYAGFVIANVLLHDGINYIGEFTVPGDPGGTFNTVLNGDHSLAVLLYPLHRHGRWADAVLENGNAFPAERPLKPLIEQAEITTPLCCSDAWLITDVLKTKLGKGTQTKAALAEPSGLLNITLRY